MAKKIVLTDNSGNKCYPVTRDECVKCGDRTLPEKFSELESKMNYFFSIPISFFSANSLNITSFAFLYIQQSSETEKYKRYTIKKGNYNYPTVINTALVVSIDNFDSGGLLVSEVGLGNVTNNMFVIGYTDSQGKFRNNGNSDYEINEFKDRFNRTEQPYFSFNNFKLTDTTISFEKFSFLYLRGSLSGNYYNRYTIAPGTYNLPSPSDINKALVVSLEKKDSSGNLIPFVTETELQLSQSPIYMIGFTNSVGKFYLCDTFSLANKLPQEVESISQEVESISQEVESISQSFVDVPVDIQQETLRKHVGYRLLDDGTIITGSANYHVVSDFIKIEGVVLEKIIATFNTSELENRNVAFAFYENNCEESYISSVKDFTSTITGAWRNYESKPNIPKNAKYIRISGNTTLNSQSPNIVMTKMELPTGSVYSDAPAIGYEYFTYDVDTVKEDVEDDNQTTSIIYPQSISKDNGFIRFPETYSRNGLPTRLVILNHGAGGRVTDNSTENGNSSFALLLQKKGYAVLCINGVPINMRNTDYLNGEQNGAAAHMGGFVYQRSALAAYKYVTEKYNIAKDGCFIIGRSMGGVTSLNLAMSGAIPVKALALDAPVIDSYHDAYFSGNWSGGTLGGSTPAIFAWIQQWDYCNFEDNTYTIPVDTYIIHGVTYTVTEEIAKPLANLKSSSQDMAILWYLNRNKQSGYNAYKTGDFLIKNLDGEHVYNTTTDNDDKYFGKKLPCPCKIWFGNGDTVNQIQIAERFVQKCRNGGSIVLMRTTTTTRHCVWSEMETLPNNIDISVIEDDIKCSPYAVELWNWIKRWDS